MITLAILKPHCLKNPIAYESIQQAFVTNGLKVVASKRMRLSRDEAEQFYEEHRHKFFFRRLVSLMSSGPSEIVLLSGENAIQRWRDIMGPTKVLKAVYSHPECIRSHFGISDTRNAAHGSDSEQSVAKESEFFFN
ncbi:nucleoside diphosphate kinase 6 [Anopheles ziemanni]|uniref:nucleoside diphosphate kinase 6 n=1 Tax=Anopheles coustani TaxID=139045 RepID=UPI00265871C2|nr:nucleoside diphosphate kinase 6 [Anopheles coustani]XP_058166885.1 nucleoside diphosphate kinase 6 [Anopheles ziemanni]